ncbi:hypothetical protein J3459_016925 [Metarhizium acridum]|nr:hypothetical protein J3459_016925 [Metarhizium acridum]
MDAESGGFDDEFPEHVYRGEIQRTPEQVQKDGGFYSRDLLEIFAIPRAKRAAIGFVPFEQIEGWWEVTYEHDFSNPQVGKKTQDKLQKLGGSGEAPQLAGFPRLSTAWDEDTWKQFKALPVSKSLDDMIDALCTGKDNCIKQLGQQERKPTEPHASLNGQTLVGFNILAQYLRNVLNQLREWDHPIGWAVKELDDSINGFQSTLEGRDGTTSAVMTARQR